jgi:flagellin
MRPGGIGSGLAGSALRSIAANRAATREVNTSLERLATGKQINRASDDPAGMVAADGLRVQERKLEAQIKNGRFEQMMLGAKEGAMSVVADQLIELESLIVQAASPAGLSNEEKQAIQDQADSLLQSIDFIANTSSFRGEQILTGMNRQNMGRTAVAVQGPNGEEVEYLTIGDLGAGGKLNLLDGDLELAAKVAKTARENANSYRGAMGTREKEIDSQINVWMVELEGAAGARSQIEDADYAKETAALVRGQILQEAALFTAQMSSSLLRSTVSSLLGGAKQGAQGLMAA